MRDLGKTKQASQLAQNDTSRCSKLLQRQRLRPSPVPFLPTTICTCSKILVRCNIHNINTHQLHPCCIRYFYSFHNFLHQLSIRLYISLYTCLCTSWCSVVWVIVRALLVVQLQKCLELYQTHTKLNNQENERLDRYLHYKLPVGQYNCQTNTSLILTNRRIQ